MNRSTIDASPLPTPLPPHVQPQYYAAIIAAEAIGSGSQPQIAELNIDNPTVSGYAIYEGTRLVRAVFINLKAFMKSATGARGKVTVSFDFVGGGVGSATLKRLAIQSVVFF